MQPAITIYIHSTTQSKKQEHMHIETSNMKSLVSPHHKHYHNTMQCILSFTPFITISIPPHFISYRGAGGLLPSVFIWCGETLNQSLGRFSVVGL